MLAARHGGPTEGVYQTNPSHMIVNKPRNINDEDLSDNSNDKDQPLCQPTDMSYFLQRLRLAEICRGMTDCTPVAVPASDGSVYPNVLAIDAQLEDFMNSIPSFFRIETDGSNTYTTPNPCQPPGIVVQAYMLNSLVHSQRCKLHLPYLAYGNKYPHSRETCIKSAQLIIQIEKRLEKENHPFVLARLNSSGMLYGIFLASMVLPMDLGSNGPTAQQATYCVEAADAFRVFDEARRQSNGDANFPELFRRLLHKNDKSAFEPTNDRMCGDVRDQFSDAETLPVGAPTGPSAQPYEELSRFCLAQNGSGVIPNSRPGDTIETLSDPLIGGLAQSSESFIELDGFQWDEILSGLDSSFF